MGGGKEGSVSLFISRHVESLFLFVLSAHFAHFIHHQRERSDISSLHFLSFLLPRPFLPTTNRHSLHNRYKEEMVNKAPKPQKAPKGPKQKRGPGSSFLNSEVFQKSEQLLKENKDAKPFQDMFFVLLALLAFFIWRLFAAKTSEPKGIHPSHLGSLFQTCNNLSQSFTLTFL